MRVLRKAGADTWKLATGQGLVIALVLLLLGLASFWLLKGTDEAKGQIVSWAVFGVVPVVVVVLVAFLWNLARAPIQLRLEDTEAELHETQEENARLLSGVGGIQVTRGDTKVEAPEFRAGDALEIEETPQRVVVTHRRPEGAS